MMKRLRSVGVACLLLVLPGMLQVGFAAGPTILVDEGHGQIFRVGAEGPLQLSKLAALLREAGWQVRVADGPLTDQALAGIDGLVSSGPFAPFAPSEVEAVTRFLERGGRLALMLHVAPPAQGLLTKLGVTHANGVVREQQSLLHGQPLDFWVTRFEPHPLTAEVGRFALAGCWPLAASAEGVRPIAYTGPQAWIDLNRNEVLDAADPVQSFAVAVAGTRGAGEFVVFGDDAVFQNRYLEEYNGALGSGLVHWLGRKAGAAE